MKQARILIVVDDLKDAQDIKDKNRMLLGRISWDTRKLLEGSLVRIVFATPKDLEASTCGLHIDAAINLSSMDGEKIQEQIIPCLL